jgi:hypothetical protein
MNDFVEAQDYDASIYPASLAAYVALYGSGGMPTATQVDAAAQLAHADPGPPALCGPIAGLHKLDSVFEMLLGAEVWTGDPELPSARTTFLRLSVEFWCLRFATTA